jgi:glycosyltransferase involved in cell wall biosynthesis
MTNARPKFSVCIPAYNRAEYLEELLDSVLEQSCQDFDIIICEDLSPQRVQIIKIAEEYSFKYPGKIQILKNEINLGYDGNIRKLVSVAQGEYCFFMGNDDVMAKNALKNVIDILNRYENIGFILKSYAWFRESTSSPNQVIRYFEDEHYLGTGHDAIKICFRRSGVISGYVVNRDLAQAISTSKYDGTLYYQLYLTAKVLCSSNAVATPDVLAFCRADVLPDFGHSSTERKDFTPGGYTPEARAAMVRGALKIIRDIDADAGLGVYAAVERDYANYFYPYIRDQLNLPFRKYILFYKELSKLGFGKYLSFHMYMIIGYLLKEERFDRATNIVRKYLGRSPRFRF